MEGSLVNFKGKSEKNKKIKSGICIFPFKYKGKTYNECLDTANGKICATEINPKNGILAKYGYCPHPPGLIKSTVKKAPPKTIRQKTLKIKKSQAAKAPSPPPRAKTPSPPPPPRAKTPSPPPRAKTPSPPPSVKPKNKTAKRKIKIKGIKSLPAVDVVMVSEANITKEKRWNEDFIKILEELADILQRQGEPFKSRAYQKAQETIMTFDKDIHSLDQIKDLPGIGKTITSKLAEYMETGTLRILERERANPLNLLTKIYGVGPKKAEELVKAGITTLDKLRAHPELLNDVQKIGLKYFEAIETRIPRSEIDEYQKLFTAIFQKSTPPGSKMEIVGSYRRGAQNSGDIDVIITSADKTVMKQFMDKLIQEKIVIEILSRGNTKSLTIAKLPATGAKLPATGAKLPKTGALERIPRRVDFLYSPPSEYAFALLYFTGSKIFNTVQRHRALELGYSLNEHGLYKMENKKKGDKIIGDFPTEQSIFDILHMKYKEPQERIDGRAVEQAQEQEQASAEQAPASAEQAPAPAEQEQAPAEQEPAEQAPAEQEPVQAEPVHQQMFATFKATGIAALAKLTEAQLSDLIRVANNAYYCNQLPLLTDNEYDILREYTLDRFPKNKTAAEGHTQCPIAERNKVVLPYEMWSMDKIKPDTMALAKWIKTYTGPYVFSCKLDGVSGLYSTEGEGPAKLYTRGNGLMGQDVSHLIPYLRLPATKNVVVRGEFIVAKAVFKQKYSKDFANPRNFVAGIINQKKIDPSRCNDVDFVIYEVIKPSLKPSDQMAFIKKTGFKCVNYITNQIVSNELLSETLMEWRADYAYEMDGLICVDDKIYPRQTGNPAHAFAFKMVLSEQMAEAKVVGVIWNISKDGYLKPRVQIEPIQLGGVTIEYATGFNAKFIMEQKIGVGAVIRLIRSGDVVPHIIAVLTPATEPQMPTQAYEWNATHVDIMLKDKTGDETVKTKNVTYFFTNIDVEGLGPGNMKKIMAAGYQTVPQILSMTEADFLKVAGFKQKMAAKIKTSLMEKIAKATLPELMHATNIFGRGFGVKKFQLILAAEPTILLDTTMADKAKRVAHIDGMAKKTAEQFVQQIPVFLAFLSETHLLDKLEKTKEPGITKDVTHPLYEKNIVLTGFRDKELIEKLEAVGAVQGNSVRKNTFLVLTKNTEEDTTKTLEAKALGIPIMTPAELKEKFKI